MPADDIKPLLYWCKEREKMRLKRQQLVGADGSPIPGVVYTTDPILAMYRFCNLRRAEDRVSRWLRNNVLTPENIELDLASFLMFSAWCRWVNWPPTIKAVMDAGLYPRKKVNWVKIGALVDELGKTGKAWTGAYMVRAPGRGKKKGAFIAEEVIGTHFKALLPSLIGRDGLFSRAPGPSYQEIWNALRKAPNFGSFMAGQVAGDWTYTPLLQNALDLTTWAPMGPGSIRGFNRIIGNPNLKQKPSEELWIEKLGIWRTAIIQKLGPGYGDLTALDVQNSLCEISKYLAVQTGTGRVRANYKTHSGVYEL